MGLGLKCEVLEHCREDRIMKNAVGIAFVLLVLGVFATGILEAPQSEKLPDGRGGTFDVSRHSIPLGEIRGGGPPKDGIPSLSNPEFVSADQGDKFLLSWERVLGVKYNGVAKAYPIKILNWHEVVNDSIDDKPIAVSW